MNQVFTHQARPAIEEAGEFARQRRYGRTRIMAHMGVSDHSLDCNATVFRMAPADAAELRLETPHGYTCAHLTPDALRELARCLIDAAADIECEGAQA